MGQLVTIGSFGYIEANPGEPGMVKVDGLLCHLWIKNREDGKGQIQAYMSMQEAGGNTKFPNSYYALIENGNYQIVDNTGFPKMGGYLIGFRESDLDSINRELTSHRRQSRSSSMATSNPLTKLWRLIFGKVHREGHKISWAGGQHDFTLNDDLPQWQTNWLLDGKTVRIGKQPSPDEMASALDTHFGQLRSLAHRYDTDFSKKSFVGLARVKMELSYAIRHNTSYESGREVLGDIAKQFSKT